MTSKPRLRSGSKLVPGLAAVALFVTMSLAFLNASFDAPAGFPADANITANIGYAMFDLGGMATIPSEGFLVAFEIIDIVLVAALVGSVMLARREVGGQVRTALRTEGSSASDDSSTRTGGDD